jgi:membrane carboxypeptidase/penicillin-binding protein
MMDEQRHKLVMDQEVDLLSFMDMVRMNEMVGGPMSAGDAGSTGSPNEDGYLRLLSEAEKEAHVALYGGRAPNSEFVVTTGDYSRKWTSGITGAMQARNGDYSPYYQNQAKYTGRAKGSGDGVFNIDMVDKIAGGIGVNMDTKEGIIDFAKSAGIIANLPPYTSLALGAAEIPLLQMLQAYTIFPNKGFNTEPIFITRIEDKNGNVLEEFPQITSKQIISDKDAYTMIKLMQGVVQIGTGRSLNNYDIPAEKAGKTGTTNDNTDGWFIGYTPELLAGTWVGCDDPFIRIYSGTSGGNEMALPKLGYFMNKVYADRTLPYGKNLFFEEPANMANDPIYADEQFADIVNQGDSNNLLQDQGNGDAIDFFNEPLPEIPIESQLSKEKPDTNTKNKITTNPLPNKAEDKKVGKSLLPPAQPADKNKIPTTNSNKQIPKKGNN